jgi:hypothetical protein
MKKHGVAALSTESIDGKIVALVRLAFFYGILIFVRVQTRSVPGAE